MWTLKIREEKVKELIAGLDNVNVIRNLLSQGNAYQCCQGVLFVLQTIHWAFLTNEERLKGKSETNTFGYRWSLKTDSIMSTMEP